MSERLVQEAVLAASSSFVRDTHLVPLDELELDLLACALEEVGSPHPLENEAHDALLRKLRALCPHESELPEDFELAPTQVKS